MGAMVGGLQAAGHLDEFADWAKSLTQRTILRLLDPSISAAGVLRAEKILDAVRDILGPVTIEQLPIPYTAVATDLLAGKSVWFQRGPLDEAIRASIAIPGVIAPHAVDGRLLADGGILDPLPMAPLVGGQRRPDHRGEPQRQRGHRQPRAGARRHRRVVEPHGAQHFCAARHHRRPVAARPADRARRAEPIRRGYLVRGSGRESEIDRETPTDSPMHPEFRNWAASR